MRAPVLAVVAGALALVAAAPSAVAAPTLDVVCQSRGSQFSCFTDRGGGSPMTVTWTRNGVPVPAWDGMGFVLGLCTPGEVVAVAATVTDPTGSATDGETFPCNTGPWP
ncbi:hypothetical protein AB0G02_41310 [Actinosynnema sp. NPDC023658]|uniref:hypothetical protein n=1 Tax=Actinosynnema sp. NPDC023658 TaxID=3155465 RepID=UPI0033D48DB3